MSHKQNPAILRLYTWLAMGAIHIFGALPFVLNRLLATIFGWLLILLPGENKRSTATNIALCLPELSKQEQRQLTRRSLMETSRGTLEMPYVWQHPQKALNRIQQVHGKPLLDAAIKNGRSVIILAPHLGCWELLNYWLAYNYPLHVLFKPSGIPAVDTLIANSRKAFGTTVHPTNRRGMTGLIKGLRQGAMTAILPDQVADRRSEKFVPFFGQPASTASLTCRLIQQTNAQAFCCFAKRLPGSRGYEIVIAPTTTAIYTSDIQNSMAAMNGNMETLIRQTPEQYLWSYKRFRRQPNGNPSPYKK